MTVRCGYGMLDTGPCESTLIGHTSFVKHVSVLPDGRIVSGSGDCTLRIWNITTGVCDHVLIGHTDSIMSVCVLPDGRIASSSADSTLRTWNADTGVCEHVLRGHRSFVTFCSARADGRIVSSSRDKTLRICYVKALSGRRTIGSAPALSNDHIVTKRRVKKVRFVGAEVQVFSDVILPDDQDHGNRHRVFLTC